MKRFTLLTAIGLCAALVLAVGTHAQDQRQASAPPAPPETAGRTLPEFRLSPGDVIEIKFFYNEELNDSVQIRPDGRLALPLVGDVELAGKSVAEATRHLETIYVPHLKTPAVTIVVRVFASQKVYVGGEVVRPGVISITGEMRVFDALMEAGGVKRTGKTDSVVLVRKNPGGGRTLRVLRLRDSKGAPSAEADLALQPFDALLVPETKIARVDRWVDQHIRQAVPVVITAGFSYLFNAQVVQ
jgi:protein involved in polysaccharide export with SLBB domain